ncbi:hypothetical protein [Streptomyces sp. NPDC089795]|uniref:hypothetical protein n=1 Tax=Streptomyces sp. NPDC089795 TaxID=3155297 RepID=UPI00343E7A6F
MLQAYVLVEFDIDVTDVQERVRAHSLGMCKQTLIGSAASGELILHLDAEDGSNLNGAMVDLASQIEGVKRLTMLRADRTH